MSKNSRQFSMHLFKQLQALYLFCKCSITAVARLKLPEAQALPHYLVGWPRPKLHRCLGIPTCADSGSRSLGGRQLPENCQHYFRTKSSTCTYLLKHNFHVTEVLPQGFAKCAVYLANKQALSTRGFYFVRRLYVCVYGYRCTGGVYGRSRIASDILRQFA